MSILDEINQSIITEYKGGNDEKRVLLQTVKSEILAHAKDLKRDLNDNEAISVIKKEVKIRLESKTQFENGGRDDLAQKASREIEILNEYLPEGASAEEVEKIVNQVIEANPDKNFGKIMKESLEKLAGRADGAKVAPIVKQKLNL